MIPPPHCNTSISVSSEKSTLTYLFSANFGKWCPIRKVTLAQDPEEESKPAGELDVEERKDAKF